jgi:CTP synthase (UTP-ammonia lyase)
MCWQRLRDVRSSSVRITVVGDFQPDRETHRATTAACEHTAAAMAHPVVVTWVGTRELVAGAVARLADADGVWIAPGSPYESMDGALGAIRFARTAGCPLLGTCAGFQHVILEYARNVLGITAAQHAEYDPDASTLFITALTCSLIGQTMSLDLLAGTTARHAYGADSTTERYYCNFGLNKTHLAELQAGGLVVSGVDQDGEVRVIELRDHPFYVATLFVPQVASTTARPHPLVQAFMRAALHSYERRVVGHGAMSASAAEPTLVETDASRR